MSEAVQDMIQNALDQDYNNANKVFGDIMTIKMNDLLDQEQTKLADAIYNGVQPDEEEPDDNQLEFDLETESESEEGEQGEEETDEVEENEDDLTDEELDDIIDNMSDEELAELSAEIDAEEENSSE